MAALQPLACPALLVQRTSTFITPDYKCEAKLQDMLWLVVIQATSWKPGEP